MKYTIYQTTNNINNKYYIGAHRTDDIHDEYLGSGVHLNYSIKKHNKENFSKLIIGQFKSEEIMYWIERMIVDQEMVDDLCTYNKKIGGLGGWDHCNTEEIKEQRNINHKNTISKMTPEERKNHFSRNTKGSKNARAKKINIYDKNDNLMFTTYGNFKRVCKENNLPYDSLKRTYQNDKRLYMNMRDCDLTRTLNKYKDWYDNYLGWYAKVIP
ncbi:MAG: hypothetical protein J7L15_00305 [Clostridiales bacterium]|nr:hypothetical protein [Clostridiales bacterium]